MPGGTPGWREPVFGGLRVVPFDREKHYYLIPSLTENGSSLARSALASLRLKLRLTSGAIL
jgi:hypothetical protein